MPDRLATARLRGDEDEKGGTPQRPPARSDEGLTSIALGGPGAAAKREMLEAVAEDASSKAKAKNRHPLPPGERCRPQWAPSRKRRAHACSSLLAFLTAGTMAKPYGQVNRS
jgi:hypothetical protein